MTSISPPWSNWAWSCSWSVSGLVLLAGSSSREWEVLELRIFACRVFLRLFGSGEEKTGPSATSTMAVEKPGRPYHHRTFERCG